METYNVAQEQRLENAKRWVKKIKGFYIHTIVFVCVNLLIIGENFYDTPTTWFNYDNFATAIFWGIGLIIHGLTVFAPDFILGKEWEEKQIQKHLNS